jgi:hypothetical protein
MRRSALADHGAGRASTASLTAASPTHGARGKNCLLPQPGGFEGLGPVIEVLVRTILPSRRVVTECILPSVSIPLSLPLP